MEIREGAYARPKPQWNLSIGILIYHFTVHMCSKYTRPHPATLYKQRAMDTRTTNAPIPWSAPSIVHNIAAPHVVLFCCMLWPHFFPSSISHPIWPVALQNGRRAPTHSFRCITNRLGALLIALALPPAGETADIPVNQWKVYWGCTVFNINCNLLKFSIIFDVQNRVIVSLNPSPPIDFAIFPCCPISRYLFEPFADAVTVENKKTKFFLCRIALEHSSGVNTWEIGD